MHNFFLHKNILIFRRFFNSANRLGVVVNVDYKQSDKTASNGVLFDRDAKELVYPVCEHFRISKFDIAREMSEDEIFEDVRTLLNEILEFSRL